MMLIVMRITLPDGSKWCLLRRRRRHTFWSILPAADVAEGKTPPPDAWVKSKDAAFRPLIVRLAEWLRTRRTAEGLSKYAAAKRLGVKWARYRDWESGRIMLRCCPLVEIE